jgi:ABC-type lipoprotein export system ATPase subunit
VRENILLPLRIDGAGRKEIEAVKPRFERLVRVLGLGGLLDRSPEGLSGGEKQRVAIARALIASPSLVLADDPTGNLDAKSTREICALFKTLNETEESAFLVVTHDPAVAAAAKKVFFLKDGAVSVTCGTEGGPAAIAEKALEAC